MKLSVLALICVCLFVSDKVIKGHVVRVSDGDTVTLLTDQREQIRVRLDGIDAPERGQDYGQKATLFVREICYNKPVIVHKKGVDRYGRVLGVLYVDGVNINEALVRHGLAWHYKHYSKDPRLDSLERLARKEKLNIWNMEKPIAPWEFRMMKKK
ncbi:micrococcal nuclease [Dysgonomonas sp. PFB1-18]|uniref:thermonuclease family protein n=1 Tax=unclassified Dysgonomonas TaxID=2630389 RepID=UPI00247F066C|nr:micrococcal nuclease [Dysgonomonas sp. PF1-14]MDH6337463.1 micrococcal nuclease [Dysgonomonas sp. PF1-16]MDH6379387.1 micrococcal nuclease [Dysgonomonas sp. PFB1-18]MDH6395975.1 micrococcal nuclease [Dysgonomonas sp. PF1-23]